MEIIDLFFISIAIYYAVIIAVLPFMFLLLNFLDGINEDIKLGKI